MFTAGYDRQPLKSRLQDNHGYQRHQNSADRRIQTIVEDSASKFRALSGRGGIGSCQLARMRPKPDQRGGIEHLLPCGGKGHSYQPTQWQKTDPCISRPPHLDDDGGGYAQSNRSQQLIADSEERPKRVDSTQWILNSLP